MALTRITAEQYASEVLQHPGRVVVDFYADWCGPCRAIAPLLERFADQYEESVKVVKIDADAAEELSRELNVMKIPTLISYRDGKEVARAVFPRSMEALEELIEAE